jgi:hypothetical protein
MGTVLARGTVTADLDE